MSVVFFEGFSVTPFNPAYWTFTTHGISNPYTTANDIGSETPGLRLSSNNNGVAGSDVVEAQVAFSSQTSGKVYIGFRALNIYAGQYSPYEHKFCTFHDNSGAEICSIYLGRGSSSSELSMIVRQGASTRATYYLSSPVLPLNTTYGRVGDAQHFEFELDIDNDTLAIRVNGQYPTGADPAAPLVLATAFSSVARLTYYGYVYSNSSFYVYFDDLFVVNSSGTFANTWLGPDARVRSRPINDYSLFTNQNWTGSDYPVVLSSNDGDGGALSTKTLGAVYAVSFNNMSLPSGSAIGGVKLSTVARATSLPVAYRHVVANSPDVYEVGDTAVLGVDNNVNYPVNGNRTLLTFINQNPATSAQWTPAELDNTNYRFGVKTVAVPE